MESLYALGPWNWLILAALLLALEVMLPGVFFMWFGLAAAVTALIAFAFDVSWQWQFVWFGLLSLASVGAALKYLRKHPPESDRPLLNERAVQHIGQSFSLVDPIVNGRGSVKIGDSIWRVEGPDLPKGTRVRVLGADGSLLKVAPDGAEAA
jgi:membrane protein implicated in regulation of membrane protease activity